MKLDVWNEYLIFREKAAFKLLLLFGFKDPAPLSRVANQLILLGKRHVICHFYKLFELISTM